MASTRVDNPSLKAVTIDLRGQLERLRPALEAVLVTDMTEEERESTVRPPVRMIEAARDVANNAGPFMGKLAAVEYDPVAVLEDLDNLVALIGIGELLGEIKRWVDDSRLRFTSESFQMTMKAYDLGKILVESDGSHRPLVEPVASVYAARKKPKGKGEEA